MALKSGLLSESTWALDVLAVLLRDDVTVAWFGLQHLPGLVDVLLEHFRRCLIELFPGDFDDLEVMFGTWLVNKDEDAKDWKTEFEHEGSLSSCPSQSAGSTQVVHIEANSFDEELVSDDKKWDVYGDVDSSMLDWQIGRGDLTTHIQTHFSQPGSLDFASDRFFGQSGRLKLSPEQASKVIQEVGGVPSQKMEDSTSSPVEKIPEQLSSGSLDSTKEKSCTGCDTETVPTSEPYRPLAGRCKHGLCQTTLLMSEDTDDADQKWLRLELKRLWSDEWDSHDDLDEDRNLSVLSVVGDAHQDTSSRCLALSNIIRGLSFIPGNDSELARHPGVLATLSRLLLFRHHHSRPASNSFVHQDEVLDGRPLFDVVEVLRENALVTFANVAGQLELSSYPEEICVPVLDGLLHWASCRAPCAVDPLPSTAYHRDLVSAQRLALEALCKLCVTDANVDLLLATPPFDRVVSILGNLVGAMANPDCDQVWREFAIVFASSLVASDPGVARALAMHRSTIPVLVGFVEAAVVDSAPSTGGTSADMIRRASAVLRAVADLPEGRSDLARNFQSRLLQLAVSPSLDSTVLNTFAHILHICSEM